MPTKEFVWIIWLIRIKEIMSNKIKPCQKLNCKFYVCLLQYCSCNHNWIFWKHALFLLCFRVKYPFVIWSNLFETVNSEKCCIMTLFKKKEIKFSTPDLGQVNKYRRNSSSILQYQPSILNNNWFAQ